MTAANPPVNSVWVERRGRRAIVLAVDERYVYLVTDGSRYRRHTRSLRMDFLRSYRRAESPDG